MQNDELEGGATALAMVFVYFGKIIPVSKIILGFKDLRNGYTAADIVRSAKKRGAFMQRIQHGTRTLIITSHAMHDSLEF